MLVDKTIKVEKEIDDLVSQIVTVVTALKQGQGVTQVVISELLKLQSLVADVKASPADFNESFSGALKAITNNAADLAAVLLGKV